MCRYVRPMRVRVADPHRFRRRSREHLLLFDEEALFGPRSLVGVQFYRRTVVIGGSVFVRLGMAVLVLVGLAVVIGAHCPMFVVVLDSKVVVHGVVAVCVVTHTVSPMSVLWMNWLRRSLQTPDPHPPEPGESMPVRTLV